MTLGERLRLVRGAETQKAFAAALGVHENSVANAERRNSATQDYLLRIAEVRKINRHGGREGGGASAGEAVARSPRRAAPRLRRALLRRAARNARPRIARRGDLSARD